jgi:hypothetical protein
MFNIPIPEHPGTDNPDEASATTKTLRYRELNANPATELDYAELKEVTETDAR